MVIIISFRADVMYCSLNVGNYIELRSVRGWRRYLEVRTALKIMAFFCRNTKIAYNHQHSSMATCFGVFYIIFRPILIYSIPVKSSINIPCNWHTYNESTFITCGPGSSVGIKTGYELDCPGSNPGGDDILRTCPDRPWGPPSLLLNGYQVFPGVRSGRGVTLTPHPTSSTEVKRG